MDCARGMATNMPAVDLATGDLATVCGSANAPVRPFLVWATGEVAAREGAARCSFEPEIAFEATRFAAPADVAVTAHNATMMVTVIATKEIPPDFRRPCKYKIIAFSPWGLLNNKW